MSEQEFVGPWVGGVAPIGDVAAVSEGNAPIVEHAASGEPASVKLVFLAARWQYFKLMLKATLLYLPTFGFYRFWLRTEQRRFWANHIEIDGDRLDYRGTPKELLVGFLVAIAVYLPLYIVYTMIGLYAESLKSFASIPFVIIFWLFTYYAVFRGRRYRLTRTVFRGVRLWMEGSAWKFAFKAFGLMILTSLTLFIAYPWYRAWYERAMMRSTFYGSLEGDFVGTGGQLFRRTLGPLILIMLFGAIPILNLLLMSMFMVEQKKWWLQGLRIGPVQLKSDLTGRAFFMPALKSSGIGLVVAGVMGGIGYAIFIQQILISGLLMQGETIFTTTSFIAIALAGLYLMFSLLLLGFVKHVFYDYPIMRKILESCTFENTQALDGIEGRAGVESAFGEGFADALGSDGF